MESTEQEYVIVPWNTDSCETEVCTLSLPSRDCVVQLEVPVWIADQTREESETHDVSMEEILAEKLEYNMAELSVLKARYANGPSETKTHLTEARNYLSELQVLDTADIEKEITAIWKAEL